VSGTIVGRHATGPPSELEAHQDVGVREELALAPIIGELAGRDGTAAAHETRDRR
jgi:hypothetical protein